MEILKGLPVRVEEWITAHLGWKPLVGCLWSLLAFFGIAVIVQGILQGIAYNAFQTSIQPWLGQIQTGITNGLLLTLSLGWAFLGIAVVLLFLIYGADRRRLGQLEVVGKENAEREQQILKLNTQKAELQNQCDIQSRELTDQVARHEQEEATLLTVFGAIDRELMVFFTRGFPGEEAACKFYESVCRRIFDLFDNGNHVFRASVYVPAVDNPDYLTIKWDHGVGEVSRWYNRWYIGPLDPQKIDAHRGIPGEVYMLGESRVRAEARDDPDFWDAHKPSRLVLPYHSIVQAPIHPNDKQTKCGVLSLDSLDYVFTERDRRIVEEAAIRLGWLMCFARTMPSQPREEANSNATGV